MEKNTMETKPDNRDKRDKRRENRLNRQQAFAGEPERGPSSQTRHPAILPDACRNSICLTRKLPNESCQKRLKPCKDGKNRRSGQASLKERRKRSDDRYEITAPKR